jgi:hypothetical protein
VRNGRTTRSFERLLYVLILDDLHTAALRTQLIRLNPERGFNARRALELVKNLYYAQFA